MPTTASPLSAYPPLNVQVHTSRLSLLGATDELLERLIPTVRKGVVTEPPWPFDDPASLYEDSPEREWRWLRGVWLGRGRVNASQWPAEIKQWRLTREQWATRRRDDIELVAVHDCLPVLGITR